MNTVNLPWHPSPPVSPELLAVFGCSRTWVSLSVNSYIPWGTFKGFLDGSDGKESTCNAGAWVQSLGWEDPLENGMAIHSSILAWLIPWTEEPGGLQSMGLQKVGHDWATNTHTLGELLQFWLQKHVPDPQSPSLPKTPGGAGENAPPKTVLMSPSSLGTHGRGSVSRKISEMAVPVLGVRQEPSESVEGDRSVANLFPTSFFLASCPFCSFVAGSGTQLLRNVFIKSLFYKMMTFVLVLLVVIALFFCMKEHFPLFFSCSGWIEFSFRLFVSCSCFSDGSGFLPTHPIISLNSLKNFSLNSWTSWLSLFYQWHSLLLQELCLQPQMFLLLTLLVQKADFILCPWIIIFNNSVVCLYSSISWRKSSNMIGNSLF